MEDKSGDGEDADDMKYVKKYEGERDWILKG